MTFKRNYFNSWIWYFDAIHLDIKKMTKMKMSYIISEINIQLKNCQLYFPGVWGHLHWVSHRVLYHKTQALMCLWYLVAHNYIYLNHSLMWFKTTIILIINILMMVARWLSGKVTLCQAQWFSLVLRVHVIGVENWPKPDVFWPPWMYHTTPVPIHTHTHTNKQMQWNNCKCN